MNSIIKKEDNNHKREEFIDYWVDYMKSHSDLEWSRQQNVLINSQLQTAKQWTREEFKDLLHKRE